MEEVQSWWQVPSVAHFFYVFRSSFNLLYFEIAELEAALLDMQDPDMCISLEQLIIRLLQGCYDDEITDENWHERLQEFLEESSEEEERDNPLDKSVHFLQLTPYSKIQVLLRLCELRLDVKGAFEEIRNIPSEDMQAKCLGKDNQNNLYWYFCDERLYKENVSNSSNGKKVPDKSKTNTSVSKRQAIARGKKAQTDVDKSWSIICFNMSDWEKLLKQFSKSKSATEKELSAAIEKYLPLIQEKVAEKDRFLRKRFLELAPKRSSSRISKVQAKKRLEELKFQEAAKQAEEEREKELAKKEADKKKLETEGRNRRAEERLKIIEGRAERAKLREITRSSDTDSDDTDSDDEEISDSDDEEEEISDIDRKKVNLRPQRKQTYKDSSESDEASDTDRKRVNLRRQINQTYQNDSGENDEEASDTDRKRVNKKPQRKQTNRNNSGESGEASDTDRKRVNKRPERKQTNHVDSDESIEASDTDRKRVNKRPQRKQTNHNDSSESGESDSSVSEDDSENSEYDPSNNSRQRTFKNSIKTRRQSNCGKKDSAKQQRISPRRKNDAKRVKYNYDSDESQDDSDVPSNKFVCHANRRQQSFQNKNNEQSNSKKQEGESSDENSTNSSSDNNSDNNSNKHRNSVSQPNSLTLSNVSRPQGINSNLSPRVTLYKNTVLHNSSDVSRWNSALDSKGQKLHILHDSRENLSSKKLKLEQGKQLRITSPNIKSSTSKENQVFKPFHQNFITFGKITPSPVVRLNAVKLPSNHQIKRVIRIFYSFALHISHLLSKNVPVFW